MSPPAATATSNCCCCNAPCPPAHSQQTTTAGTGMHGKMPSSLTYCWPRCTPAAARVLGSSDGMAGTHMTARRQARRGPRDVVAWHAGRAAPGRGKGCIEHRQEARRTHGKMCEASAQHRSKHVLQSTQGACRVLLQTPWHNRQGDWWCMHRGSSACDLPNHTCRRSDG